MEKVVVHAWGKGPTIRQLIGQLFDVCKAVPLFLVTPLLRPWHQRWGATDAEVAASMPGDDIVPDCQYAITRAISIDRPLSAVWPWLLQIGFVLNEFGDFAMMRKMLFTIKKNVEADHRGVAA